MNNRFIKRGLLYPILSMLITYVVGTNEKADWVGILFCLTLILMTMDIVYLYKNEKKDAFVKISKLLVYDFSIVLIFTGVMVDRENIYIGAALSILLFCIFDFGWWVVSIRTMDIKWSIRKSIYLSLFPITMIAALEMSDSQISAYITFLVLFGLIDVLAVRKINKDSIKRNKRDYVHHLSIISLVVVTFIAAIFDDSEVIYGFIGIIAILMIIASVIDMIVQLIKHKTQIVKNAPKSLAYGLVGCLFIIATFTRTDLLFSLSAFLLSIVFLIDIVLTNFNAKNQKVKELKELQKEVRREQGPSKKRRINEMFEEAKLEEPSVSKGLMITKVSCLLILVTRIITVIYGLVIAVEVGLDPKYIATDIWGLVLYSGILLFVYRGYQTGIFVSLAITIFASTKIFTEEVSFIIEIMNGSLRYYFITMRILVVIPGIIMLFILLNNNTKSYFATQRIIRRKMKKLNRPKF